MRLRVCNFICDCHRISFLLNCCFHLLIIALVSVRPAVSSSPMSLSRNSQSGDSQLGTSQRQRPDPVMVRLLESSLLKALGLKSRPRPDRSKVTVSDAMLELYYQQTGQDALAHVSKWKRSKPKRGRIADTVRSFSPTYGDDVSTVGHKEIMLFDIASLPRDDDIKAAEIKIFINQKWALHLQDEKQHDKAASSSSESSDASRTNHRFLVRIHEILLKAGEDSITRPLDSKIVDVSDGSRWVTFDILPAVQRWQSDPTSNEGLEIEMLTPAGLPLYHERLSSSDNELIVVNPIRQKRSVGGNVTQAVHHVKPEKQPNLMVHSNDPKSKQSKNQRKPSQNQRSGSPQRQVIRSTCQKQHLYVDFNDVQWTDWIVAPPGYVANMCSGECSFPLSDNLNTTNHAVVQSLVHHANSALRSAPPAPNPCCVPTDLSPISLLYVDEYDKIVLKNYQDMVVEGCGCR